MAAHWDIFCRVIDNYGDVGVCWRLARQLVEEHGIPVRLWLDRPEVLCPLVPEANPDVAAQCVAGVDVRRWAADFAPVPPAGVVVEAFACELPAAYLEAMAGMTPPPCWINLEYLSAEPWAEEWHGMQSPHPKLPLRKTFFFPGPRARQGGLLRERWATDHLAPPRPVRTAAGPLRLSVFCYDTAPVSALLEAVGARHEAICRLAPGQPMAALIAQRGDVPAGIGRLRLDPGAFVPQRDFDAILRDTDINFVRGEDSLVRAIWAGRPFVWQLYKQADDAHLAKLDAFLDVYLPGLSAPAAEASVGLWRAWNGCGDLPVAWEAYARHLPELASHALAWAERQAQAPDLANNLVTMCRDAV